jgi:hypothetical protein
MDYEEKIKMNTEAGERYNKKIQKRIDIWKRIFEKIKEPEIMDDKELKSNCSKYFSNNDDEYNECISIKELNFGGKKKISKRKRTKRKPINRRKTYKRKSA